jgi:sulfate adenylyltransferase subunit 1 (EFTu-like GTPase family)
MSARGPNRRHSLQFKIQICSDVSSGAFILIDASTHQTVAADMFHLPLPYGGFLGRPPFRKLILSGFRLPMVYELTQPKTKIELAQS